MRASGRFSFRSLRVRIILLALFACLLLVAAGASFFFFLNSSQQAKLDAAQRNLLYLVAAMKGAYAAQLPHGFSLREVQRPAPPRPPAPLAPRPSTQQGASAPAAGSPGAQKGLEGPPPPPPPPPDNVAADPLTRITASVLRRESDVEGGFYSADSSVLSGYAFPTHEGPGGSAEIPGKERPEIEALARAAVRTGEPQKQSFHGDYDAILFVAIPIQDGNQITGAAWLMQRMAGLESGRSKQLLLGSIGFAAAAVVCTFLTFFITSEVNLGVQSVLARLGAMEGSLGKHPEDAKPRLKEFEQVLTRVDALSDSLKLQIETQRALEDEVRHRQRLSALGQFAAGVAHELRNPLATIRLRAQMSQRATDTHAVERNSAVVLDEVARLDTMIERLLYFSRPIHLKRKSRRVATLCQAAFEAWKPRCDAEEVVLKCHVAEEPCAAYDASRMRQVLDNLLENALQSVLLQPSGNRRIELSGRGEKGTVVLEVLDTGAGLEAEALAHALEPFYTTKETGTGLGLSISYEIVQAHGGDLQLRNAPGGGAIALIRLPEANSDRAGSESW